MFVTLLFWLGLLLPGYAAQRLVSQEDLKSGLLGVVGVSYLAAFALLSPVSILCYVLHLPVAVFSAACVLAFLIAAVVVTKKRWWLDIGRLLVAGLSVELLIVAGDMVMGGRVGAFLEGDAVVHVARIRFLLDHGFSNWNAYVAAEHFYPIYHTNILHALYAACSQLSGVDVLGTWYASLVWAKLVIAAGVYYMTWCVFERSWAAWLAALFVLGSIAPVTFYVYPNKLSPCWLLPMMIGFAVQASQSPCTWRSPIKLAAGSLVLGQVHGLYAVFAGLMLAPALAGLLLIRLVRGGSDHEEGKKKGKDKKKLHPTRPVRGGPDRLRVAACIAALCVAAPFLLASKYGRPAGPSSQATSAPTKKRSYDWQDGGGIVIPGNVLRLELLALGIVCAMATSRRKQAAVVVTAAGVVVAILHLVPIRTVVVDVLAADWIVGRMDWGIRHGVHVLLFGSLGYLLEPRVCSRWTRSLISTCVVLLAGQYANLPKEYDWAHYYPRVISAQERRHGVLSSLRRYRAFFHEHIPSGSTVLTDESTAMWLVKLHDCFVVAPRRGKEGIADISQRRADLSAMLAASTPWEMRRDLLRKYGITQFVISASTQELHGPVNWPRGHVKQRWKIKTGEYMVLSLTTE